MSKYRFMECKDVDQWDQFVDKSPQGTIFSKSVMLQAVSVKQKYYFIMKGEEPVGGTSILIGKEGEPLIEVPYMHYKNSILFKNNNHLLSHKRITEEFRISELIINEILNIYMHYNVTNTPHYNDMRPFQWHNYHSPEQGVFTNKLLFTPVITLNQLSENEIVGNMRTSRRQEYRKRGEYYIYESDQINIIDRLHSLTFIRQGLSLTELESALFLDIAESALINKYGRLTICEYEGEQASANLFLYDNKRSYYLFGANHPNFRHTGASTKLMIENILYTKVIGLNEVDLVGANSPNRGDYKISFNASIYPYYNSSIIRK